MDFLGLVVERIVDDVGERDVVRLRQKVVDNLERTGDADLDGVLRRGGKKPVVPAAAVAEALSAAPSSRAEVQPCCHRCSSLPFYGRE